MKYNFTIINFKNTTKTYQKDKIKIVEYYNDNNKLLKRLEYDEFERDIDCKNFDEDGNLVSHQHKEYFETNTEKGLIETFKNHFQEYVRKQYVKFINGYKHSIEEFVSKSKPENSYKNEFIYDLQNNLVNVISKKLK